jgi:hypothetical protein
MPGVVGNLKDSRVDSRAGVVFAHRGGMHWGQFDPLKH